MKRIVGVILISFSFMIIPGNKKSYLPLMVKMVHPIKDFKMWLSYNVAINFKSK